MVKDKNLESKISGMRLATDFINSVDIGKMDGTIIRAREYTWRGRKNFNFYVLSGEYAIPLELYNGNKVKIIDRNLL